MTFWSESWTSSLPFPSNISCRITEEQMLMRFIQVRERKEVKDVNTHI